MLRSWGGIVDVTPDRSPIIGRTPIDGLFVNCGWGTGGFKATPGSGHVFAHTLATGEPWSATVRPLSETGDTPFAAYDVVLTVAGGNGPALTLRTLKLGGWHGR